MRTIGIDTGGTFTDLVLAQGTQLSVAKVPSTPRDPSRAVERGLAALGGTRSGDALVHGTTVALNALLTGKTARVALVTNRGFADVIEIARQERPDIYALHPVKPEPLVPRGRRFEIGSRVWPREGGDGLEVVCEPTDEELGELARAIEKSGVESIAVCLLHSWADRRHEERVALALSALGLPVTTSSGIVPAHREFERFSTAIVNAALVPRMRAYLERLGNSLAKNVARVRLSILQSSGGTLSAERAAQEPVRILFSGPAGGVVGAALAAREAGLGAFVGLDMGGTSTDVSFLDSPSDERRSTRAQEPACVSGHPIAVPGLDIHTIGCGGGSLATLDAGGVLHVGPESAGADPGPVAYGRSDALTVTDAHVLLGHVAEGPFLSGGLALDTDAVRAAFEILAKRLGSRASEAARGVLDVARASMRRAIGVMTMQRGRDPRRSSLVAFGGAGGLHAAALVEGLGMREALVPLHPGLSSARGMTAAAATLESVRTLLAPLERFTARDRARMYEQLEREARSVLSELGQPPRSLVVERGLDLRYRGQSHEIHLPEGAAVKAAFHRAHEKLYGYSLPDREVELVCLRLRVIARRKTPRLRRVRPRRISTEAVVGERRADFGRAERALVIDRARLEPGHAFQGPALVEEFSGTTLVPPRWRALVTSGGHLLLRR